MKKALNYIVLGIFAIGALAIWLITGQAVMLASTLFILILMAIIGISEIKMGKETLPEEKPTIDSLIAQYGEPDNIIVTDPTRSSEVDGAILVYTDTLVFNQTEISKTDIVDMTFNNSTKKWSVSGRVVNPVECYELLKYDSLCWMQGVNSVSDMMQIDSTTGNPVWMSYFESRYPDDDNLNELYENGQKAPYQLFRWLQFCQQCRQLVFLEQSDALKHGDMGH